MWEAATGDCKAVLSTDDRSSTRWANLARNGELLITCCADRTVHVWDLQMGKLLRTLPCECPASPASHSPAFPPQCSTSVGAGARLTLFPS